MLGTLAAIQRLQNLASSVKSFSSKVSLSSLIHIHLRLSINVAVDVRRFLRSQIRVLEDIDLLHFTQGDTIRYLLVDRLSVADRHLLWFLEVSNLVVICDLAREAIRGHRSDIDFMEILKPRGLERSVVLQV